jgi:serine/threonine-protein kinase
MFAPLTEDLWTIIQACLKKDPNERIDADRLVEACSKLCYADSMRVEGTINRFGQFKGSFGFIRTDGGEDVFFHSQCLYGAIAANGLRVNLASFPGSPRERAFPVLALKQHDVGSQ